MRHTQWRLETVWKSDQYKDRKFTYYIDALKLMQDHLSAITNGAYETKISKLYYTEGGHQQYIPITQRQWIKLRNDFWPDWPNTHSQD